MLVLADLDNTLAAPGEPVAQRIRQLMQGHVVVTGAVWGTTLTRFGGGAYILAQNGQDACDPDSHSLWRNDMSLSDVEEALRDAERLVGHPLHDDQVQVRGCQVSVSMVGHSAEWGVKQNYDPTGDKRRMLLAMSPCPSLERFIGGTTCIDYLPKGAGKGPAIERLIKMLGRDPAECMYLGDHFGVGGNDASVLGVVPCTYVRNHEEAAVIIEGALR